MDTSRSSLHTAIIEASNDKIVLIKNELFRRDLIVHRRSGEYKNGRWQEEMPGSFEIKASVHATAAEILQTLPEGQRTKESYTLLTDTKLQTAVIEESNADVVVIENERYQVVRVTPHLNFDHITTHYQIVVLKENFDADS